IQPVLAVFPAEDDRGLVPLAGWIDALSIVRHEHVVEGAGAMARDLRVLGLFVVGELILPPFSRMRRLHGSGERLGHVVFDAAVPCLGDLPFPRELEVLEAAIGDQVHSGERLSVGLHRSLAVLDVLDGAILDSPEAWWRRTEPEPVPAV